MIKINLLGDNTAVDHSGAVMVGAYLASVVVAVGAALFFTMSLSGEIEDLTAVKAQREGDLKKIQLVTAEVKDIEKKQKDLEERLVRIATLKRNKQGPVRVMDSLNLALPERAWLVEAREKQGSMRLNGFAIDGETISAFMRELEKSDYFPKVELDVAKTATKQGVKIQEFVIKAGISYAGRIQVPEEKSDEKKPAGKPSDKAAK